MTKAGHKERIYISSTNGWRWDEIPAVSYTYTTPPRKLWNKPSPQLTIVVQDGRHNGGTWELKYAYEEGETFRIKGEQISGIYKVIDFKREANVESIVRLVFTLEKLKGKN